MYNAVSCQLRGFKTASWGALRFILPTRVMTIPIIIFAILLLVPPEAATREIASYAFVQDDGTLRIKGRVIRLFGIHIPTTGQTCRFSQNPPFCASRAAKALNFKKGANFVHCEPKLEHQDGTITALCRVNGEDLSAYLLERGWALALPDAPFEYSALEKIARHRSLGLWGFPVQRPRVRRDR